MIFTKNGNSLFFGKTQTYRKSCMSIFKAFQNLFFWEFCSIFFWEKFLAKNYFFSLFFTFRKVSFQNHFFVWIAYFCGSIFCSSWIVRKYFEVFLDFLEKRCSFKFFEENARFFCKAAKNVWISLKILGSSSNFFCPNQESKFLEW